MFWTTYNCLITTPRIKIGAWKTVQEVRKTIFFVSAWTVRASNFLLPCWCHYWRTSSRSPTGGNVMGKLKKVHSLQLAPEKQSDTELLQEKETTAPPEEKKDKAELGTATSSDKRSLHEERCIMKGERLPSCGWSRTNPACPLLPQFEDPLPITIHTGHLSLPLSGLTATINVSVICEIFWTYVLMVRLEAFVLSHRFYKLFWTSRTPALRPSKEGRCAVLRRMVCLFGSVVMLNELSMAKNGKRSGEKAEESPDQRCQWST